MVRVLPRLHLRMLRPRLSRLLAALALLLVCPVGAQARQQPGQSDGHLSAVLEGREIPLIDVGRYYCHDFSLPVYRCFRTQLGRDLDMEVDALAVDQSNPSAGSVELAASSSVTYVLAFEYNDFTGLSLALSNPAPDLSALGWSNRISSFKSTNGGHPKWWDGTNYSGTAWQWGTSAWVAYVGDPSNNRFTSVLDF
jgi:hypothetical protein